MSCDTYEIWQLRSGSDTVRRLFMCYDYLLRHGQQVDLSLFEQKYRDRLNPGDTLDSIYDRFNLNHPKDFQGHSLSVSDLIVERKEGKVSIFYVDSFGFKDVTHEVQSPEVVMAEQRKPSIRQRLAKAQQAQREKPGVQREQTKGKKRETMEL